MIFRIGIFWCTAILLNLVSTFAVMCSEGGNTLACKRYASDTSEAPARIERVQKEVKQAVQRIVMNKEVPPREVRRKEQGFFRWNFAGEVGEIFVDRSSSPEGYDGYIKAIRTFHDTGTFFPLDEDKSICLLFQKGAWNYWPAFVHELERLTDYVQEEKEHIIQKDERLKHLAWLVVGCLLISLAWCARVSAGKMRHVQWIAFPTGGVIVFWQIKTLFRLSGKKYNDQKEKCILQLDMICTSMEEVKQFFSLLAPNTEETIGW